MQEGGSFEVSVAVRPAGVVVINPRDEVLLVCEHKPQCRGLWHFPAGGVEPGEHPQDAAVREAYEEAGLTVRPLHLLDVRLGQFPDGALILLFAWLA